jgi:hypothetical protein
MAAAVAASLSLSISKRVALLEIKKTLQTISFLIRAKTPTYTIELLYYSHLK